MEMYQREEFSKTQTNLIDKHFGDLILAESDPIELEHVEPPKAKEEKKEVEQKESVPTNMPVIKEEAVSKQEVKNEPSKEESIEDEYTLEPYQSSIEPIVTKEENKDSKNEKSNQQFALPDDEENNL